MSYSQFQRQISLVVVEYDSRGKRVTKSFADTYTSRRFYVSKDKAGKNPRIVKAER